ncbi:MAG: DnaD domain protein [Christensenella sp.]
MLTSNKKAWAMIKFALDEQATTPVPTVFLKKYMCDAPADYVKVYLYGLYLANAGIQVSDVELEGALHMSAAQIEAALNYWCLKELMKKNGAKYSFAMEDITAKEDEPPKKRRAPLYEMQNFNNMLRTVLNRDLSPTELNKIYDYTDVFSLPQEVVLALVEYCVAERGNKISVAYLDKVAEAWSEQGVTTLERAQQKIEEYKMISGGANRLMRRMGIIGKYPGRTEMDLYNKWTEKWGFTHETIEYVMKGKEFSGGQPFKYLDVILGNLYASGITTSRKVSEYTSTQKERTDNIKQILEALKYSRIVVAPKHEQFYDEWRAAGFSQRIILLACMQSVKLGSRRFESVDSFLKEWRMLKLEDEEEIKKYLRKQDTIDRKIKQVFDSAGIDRSVSESDRKTYIRFTQEKGLSHDVLLYAAEYSSIKDKPFEYMTKVLSNWAEEGVDTLEKAKKQNLSKVFAQAKNTTLQREYTDEEKEQRAANALADMEQLYGEQDGS